MQDKKRMGESKARRGTGSKAGAAIVTVEWRIGVRSSELRGFPKDAQLLLRRAILTLGLQGIGPGRSKRGKVAAGLYLENLQGRRKTECFF